MPCMAWSEKLERRQPPKLKNAMGTGMGTLTPTMPTSMACTKARAAPPSRVNTAVPLANSCEFTSLIAAASVGTRTTTSTGPEDFFAIDLHRGRHAVEQAAAEEETVFVARHLVAAAVDHQARAFADTRGDVVDDPGAMRGGDQRPHVGLAILRMIDAQCLHALRERVDQPVGGGITHRHGDRNRHATLARRAVGRA